MNNKKPALLIMAAGMGSRFGGLKQMEPLGPNGEAIIDYSVYDACRAGFGEVVVVINRSIEKEFKEVVGKKIEKIAEVRYVYQDLQDVPNGFVVPPERTKPWGTGHAIYSARDVIGGPFAVINADDFYGADTFKIAYESLMNMKDDELYRYSMIGYKLKNTLSDNGTVSRGVCKADDNGNLVEIVEHTKIERTEHGARYLEDDGETWRPLDGDTLVSMNFFCFTLSFMKEIARLFPLFLEKALANDSLKGEFHFPGAVNSLLVGKKAVLKVLDTNESWYGVTYGEDRESVAAALSRMNDEGKYPENFTK